jgi:hypothetical protein
VRRRVLAALLLGVMLPTTGFGAGASPARAADAPGPSYALTDALPGGTQAGRVIASDGTGLLIGDGTRRLLREGSTETELVAPPQLDLHDSGTWLDGSLVVQQDYPNVTWYDGAGHGGRWTGSYAWTFVAAAPGGWVFATNVTTSTGTTFVRLRKVDAATGAVTTLRDLPVSALPSVASLLDSKGLRDRLVLLSRLGGRTVLTTVPFSGATQVVRTSDTSDASYNRGALFVSAAGVAWTDVASVHARLAGGAEINRAVSSPLSAEVVTGGLVYSTNGGSTLVSPNGVVTTGVVGGGAPYGSALVRHLDAGTAGVQTSGLYVLTVTGAPALLRADTAKRLTVRRVAVGADDVLWSDNGEAGAWALRAKARDLVADGPTVGVRTLSPTTAAVTTATDVSGDRAAVLQGTSLQILHRQADGSWTPEGAPLPSVNDARLTGGWLALNGLSVRNVLDGRAIDSLSGYANALAVAGDTAWGIASPPGSFGLLLRRTDLTTGRTRSVDVPGSLALRRPVAWGDAVAVVTTDGVGLQTALLRYAEDGSLLTSQTGLVGVPEALDEQLLVTRRTNGRELLALDRLTGATTVISDPYGIPAGSVSVHEGTVGWVGGDGVPRVETVTTRLAPPSYAGGASPATMAFGTPWAATLPVSGALDTCSVQIANAVGTVRDLACTPGRFQVTTSWDGLDAGGQPAPDGTYRWTLGGSGPSGQLPAAHGYFTLTGSPAATHTLTVSVDPTGPDANGVVRSDWPGIDCPTSACTATYPAGAVVTLSTEIGSGTSDGSWSGDCTASPCTVTLDQDRVVTKQLVDVPPFIRWVTARGLYGSYDEFDASVEFSEGLSGVTTSTARLREGVTGRFVPMARLLCTLSGSQVPCSTAGVTDVYFFPLARLVPGAPYAVVVAPSVVDRGGSSLVSGTSATFTAALDAPWTAATADWSGVPDPIAAGGSYAHEQQHGATFSYRFTGATVRWFFFRSPRGGRAKVTIDGVVKELAADQYAAIRYRAYRTYSGLSSGTHTLTVTVLGSHDSRSSGTDVVVDAFGTATSTCRSGLSGCTVTPVHTARLGLIDDGGWVGQGYRTMTRGSGATWTFYGTGFEVTGQGYARLSIDGRAFGPSTGFGFSLRRTGLSRGLHTVRLIASAPPGYSELLDLMWLQAVP